MTSMQREQQSVIEKLQDQNNRFQTQLLQALHKPQHSPNSEVESSLSEDRGRYVRPTNRTQTSIETQSNASTKFSVHVGKIGREGEDDTSLIGSDTPSQTVSHVSTFVPHTKAKAEFLEKIVSLHDPDINNNSLPKPASDEMERLFGGAKAYSASQPTEFSLPLSKLQEDTLSNILQPRSEQGKAYIRAEDKQLPVQEEFKHLFTTPDLNQGLAEYLSVMSARQGKDKQLLPPHAKTADRQLEKIDSGARVGMKYAIYIQWLISVIKKTLLDQLHEDDSLRDPDGPLMKCMEEAFNSSLVTTKQFGRVTNLSVTGRRQIYLDELKLKNFPQSALSELPVDTKNCLLFGSKESKDGKSQDVDGIISRYSDKTNELNKYSGAFRRPSNYVGESKKRKNSDSGSKSHSAKKRPRTDYSQKTSNKGYSDNKDKPGYFPKPEFRKKQ